LLTLSKRRACRERTLPVLGSRRRSQQFPSAFFAFFYLLLPWTAAASEWSIRYREDPVLGEKEFLNASLGSVTIGEVGGEPYAAPWSLVIECRPNADIKKDYPLKFFLQAPGASIMDGFDDAFWVVIFNGRVKVDGGRSRKIKAAMFDDFSLQNRADAFYFEQGELGNFSPYWNDWKELLSAEEIEFFPFYDGVKGDAAQTAGADLKFTSVDFSGSFPKNLRILFRPGGEIADSGVRYSDYHIDQVLEFCSGPLKEKEAYLATQPTQ